MGATTNAVKILDQMVGADSEMRAMLEEERENLPAARMAYEARTAAGVTQAELAACVPWTNVWKSGSPHVRRRPQRPKPFATTC